MKAYAIKLKNTNKYLPILWRKRYGFSHTEPTNEQLPRLFPTLRSAQNALTAWLQGKFETRTETSGMFGEDVSIYVEAIKVEGRERKNMQIVTFTLREVGTIIKCPNTRR